MVYVSLGSSSMIFLLAAKILFIFFLNNIFLFICKFSRQFLFTLCAKSILNLNSQFVCLNNELEVASKVGSGDADADAEGDASDQSAECRQTKGS